MSEIRKYKKDFNKWNIRKQSIDKDWGHKKVKPGEIWWAQLGLNIGREQDGGKTFERPVIIIRRINYFLALIAPLTSQKKSVNSHFYHKLLNTESTVLIPQLRVISTKRLRRDIRQITKEEFTIIKQLIKEFYKL